MRSSDIETSSVQGWHILMQTGEYTVYSPKLQKKERFKYKKNALRCAKSFTSEDRNIIYLHDSNGLVVDRIYPSPVVKLHASH